MRKYYFATLFFAIGVMETASAQFQLNGSARQTDSICYMLTPDQVYQIGSIWDTTKVNLNQSFQVILDVFFGCDPKGADGIVFGFQPVSTSVGSQGGGIGFGGISPSLGIEMDTYQNTTLADPPYNYMAIIKNGDVNHNDPNTLTPLVPFTVPGDTTPLNIQDCRKHDLKVTWNADSMILQVFFDCLPMLQYHGNIVRDIFNNNPLVYWGFTSAGGALYNEHDVCLTYSTFLDKLPDTTICKGGSIQLNAKGGVSYSWSPSAGLSDSAIANPIARPSSTTQYIVTVKDTCKRMFRDSQMVRVGGTRIESLNLGPDTLLCDSAKLLLNADVVNGATYRWSDNSTDSVLWVSKAGAYSVTVSQGSCVVHDSISIRTLTRPLLNFPTTLDICNGEKILLNASAPAATYLWQDSSYLPNYVVLAPGHYFVTVKNDCGTAFGDVVAEYANCHQFYVPNVFNPRDPDPKNSMFYVQDWGDVRLVTHFLLFDRWGGKVFEAFNIPTNHPELGWNGGNYPPGVYAYYAEMIFQDGKTYHTNGSLTLIR